MASTLPIDSSTPSWNPEEVKNATAKQIETYIEQRIDLWTLEDLVGPVLHDWWRQDFEWFDPAAYKKTTTWTRNLRDFLRSRNVYIPKARTPIGRQLSESILKPWSPVPDNERSTPIAPAISPQTIPNPAPYHTPQNVFTNLAKLYTDDQRFSGDPDDNFDVKYRIFQDLCDMARVPVEDMGRAFRLMLKGPALSHYYMINPQLSLSSRELSKHMKTNFQGIEHHRSMLTKWNTLTLRGIIDESDNKDINHCINLLIAKLRSIQSMLEPSLQNDTFLQAKLLTACRDHPACQIACSIPGASSVDLIGKLESNAATWKTQQTQHAPQSTFFTDRRYHGRDRRDHLDDNRRSYGENKGSSYGTKSVTKKCFVCRKPGCWSTRHTPEERQKSKDRFQQGLRERPRQYLSDTNDDDFIDQFILETEGKEEESDDLHDLIEAFDAFTSNQEIFLTSCGELSSKNASQLSEKLSTAATVHAITKSLPANDFPEPTTENSSESNPSESFITRYGSHEFQGMLIDTGAAGFSTAGANQFDAFQTIFGPQNVDASITIKIKFGIGNTTSTGLTVINTPIGRCQFHIVTTDTPFLLSLKDLDQNMVTFNNLTNHLICDGKTIPIVRKYGHAFLIWGPVLPSSSSSTYLTETELRTLHRRFGHPSARRLADLLEKSGHDDNALSAVQRIVNDCTKCQRHAGAPSRFRFTLRDDEKMDFNHSIYVDIMYIHQEPVLHVVDEATRFQAARFLPNISAETTWRALRICWIDVYIGPPDEIHTDQGSNFIATDLQQYATTLGTKTIAAPVEAAHTMAIVERYHLPLRRAFDIIKEETNLDKITCLQMAIKAINDTVGPDGIVPTLLVFGAYPRMTSSDPPSPSIIARAQAIQRAMKEVTKIRSKRQVNDALHTRNGPITTQMDIGSSVLVWRVHEKKWTGPYLVLRSDQEDVMVQTKDGPKLFRSTSVKNYTGNEDPEPNRPAGRPRRTTVQNQPQSTYVPETQLVTQFFVGTPRPTFQASREKELNGLINQGVFTIVNRRDLANPNQRTFGSRFVDTIKNEGTPNAFEKSRLVVQAFADHDKNSILTQSPTIQRASQRLILSVALIKGWRIFTRDISQAYTQSKTLLERSIIVRPPKEMNLPPDTLLHVQKPLYGIPEAGNHWFKTYHQHHTHALELKSSPSDPCLLFNGKGITGLQTDDTLFAGDNDHIKREDSELKKAGFAAKDVSELTDSTPLTFNGAKLTRKGNCILITQQPQIQKIELVNEGDITEFVSQRARGAYISSVCQPQATFALSHAAQHMTNPTKTDYNRLNTCLQWQRDNAEKGLIVQTLDEEDLKIVAFTDASFANNADMTSQIGFIIVLVNEATNRCNIIQWSSTKCKRVTRSVLAAELYAMVQGFDAASALKNCVDQIFKKAIPLIICVDSFSLYECMVKLGTTREKRLMIDISALRQAYERREIAEVIWIEGPVNPADSMTKGTPNRALESLLKGTLLINRSAWVERAGKEKTASVGPSASLSHVP